jgi:hypothetical protein
MFKRCAVVLLFARVCLLLVLLTSTCALASNHDRVYVSGKLLSSGTAERLMQGTSFNNALITVQAGDVIYTARGGRVTRHSGEIVPGVIIGDPVQVSIDGGTLRLKLPSGKEFKATIVKRERVTP